MPRYIVQSVETGRFLAPCPDGGEPVWVRSLRAAGGGVTCDLETAQQLLADNVEHDELGQIIDLDRLGSADDYPDEDFPPDPNDIDEFEVPY